VFPNSTRILNTERFGAVFWVQKKRPGNPWKKSGPNGRAVTNPELVHDRSALGGEALDAPVFSENAPQHLVVIFAMP